MNNQEDIGNLIRKKFSGTQQTSDAPLWERIEDTLQKRKRKRGFLWILSILSLLSLILGTVTITMSPETKVTQTQNKEAPAPLDEKSTPVTTPTEQTIIANEQQQAETPFHTLHQDDPNAKKESRSSVQETKTQPEEVVTSPIKISSNTSTVDAPNPNETQRTQTVYYYYNSKNGQEIKSTDKKVIDSVMQANTVKQDSLQ